MPIPNQVSQVWYREHWPWILISGPLIVVIASLISAWLAYKTSDGLVQDDYHKEGKAINRIFERDERAREFGLSGDVKLLDNTLELTISSHSHIPLPPTLRLLISHATRVDKDQTVALTVTKPGVYSGRFVPLDNARYFLTLEDPGKTWRVVGLWRDPKIIKSVPLLAAIL